MAKEGRSSGRAARRGPLYLMVVAAMMMALAACGEAAESGSQAAGGAEEEPAQDAGTEAADAGGETEAAAGDGGGDGAPTEMTVASWGGRADEVFMQIFEPFEEEFNVTINWVTGNSVENVAKVAATKDNPEFDVALKENTNQATGSQEGLWAELDPEIVTHAEDLYPQATAPNNDGAGFGFIAVGLFYKTDEFEENGWEPPTSWDDLFRDELCGRVGMLHPNVTYSLLAAMMLGGGEGTEDIEPGLERMQELAPCIPTFEPSSPALEEKVQLGEYLIGVHGSFRIMPLTADDYPVQFVYPEEGTALMLSMVSPVKNAPNPELAQEFVNWFISPDSQRILMEELYYGPTNSTVEVPEELVELGVPSVEVVEQMSRPDELEVVEHRQEWTEMFDRMLQ